MSDDGIKDEQVILLRAILAVLLEERAIRAEGRDLVPAEVLLSNAGLERSDIASLLQKSSDAVRMVLNRRK